MYIHQLLLGVIFRLCKTNYLDQVKTSSKSFKESAKIIRNTLLSDQKTEVFPTKFTKNSTLDPMGKQPPTNPPIDLSVIQSLILPFEIFLIYLLISS